MKPHLLLDLGNTRLKWALALPPAAEHPQWRLSLQTHKYLGIP